MNAGWNLGTGAASFDAGNVLSATMPGDVNDSPSTWCPAAPTPGAPNDPCWAFTPVAFDPAWRLTDEQGNLLPGVTEALNGTDAVSEHNRTGEVELGFAFPYFNAAQTRATVGDNGFLSFGGVLSGSSSNSTSIPHSSTTSGSVDSLYPFWDDLRRENALGGRVLVRTSGAPGERVFVAHWDRYAFYRSSSDIGGVASFMIVLKEKGGMEFHYERMEGWATGYNIHLGSSATIGLEAFGDTFGALYGAGSSTSSSGSAVIQQPVPFGLRIGRP